MLNPHCEVLHQFYYLPPAPGDHYSEFRVYHSLHFFYTFTVFLNPNSNLKPSKPGANHPFEEHVSHLHFINCCQCRSPKWEYFLKVRTSEQLLYRRVCMFYILMNNDKFLSFKIVPIDASINICT